MDDATFWNIIERAAGNARGDAEERAEETADGVRSQLVERPPSDIEAFERILNEKMDAAYSWDLWGAGYLMRGGCSDDGFEYFRAWVISRGRSVYDAAVAEPDSLAELADPDADDQEYECEPLLYAAREAYEEVAGTEMAPGEHGRTREPRGQRWDFDDQEESAKRLPRLSAIYDDA